MKQILLILLACVVLVYLLRVLFYASVSIGRDLGGLFSVFADIVIGIVIFAFLLVKSPFHPSNTFLNYALYFLLSCFITKFFSELYLVGYSMNFVGLTIIAFLLVHLISNSYIRIGILIAALIVPKLFWILSRNQKGSYWSESGYSGLTNTSYGHYESVNVDFKKKIYNINHSMCMPLQIVVAVVLYLVSNYAILQECFHAGELLEKFNVMSCVLASVLALVNVFVDLRFLKSYDEAMD